MESNLISFVVNSDKVSVSPPNPLPIPVKNKDITSYENKELFLIDKARYDAEVLKRQEVQDSLPKYLLKGSMCKSGMFIEAKILAYHINDARNGELHEDNTVTLHGPYK